MVRSSMVCVALLSLGGFGLLTAGCHGAREATPDVQVSTLTIYPVAAMGTHHAEFAEALGLVLEKLGYSGITATDTTFDPGDAPLFEDIAQSFGVFIAEQPLKTEYALYCEFQGTPQGVEAVRQALVDAQGKLVWTDVQSPVDAPFQRVKPSNPMSCCVLASERLAPLLVAAPGNGPGPMEERWAEKSGTPSGAQYEAMEIRQASFKARMGSATLTVFPVRVDQETDTTCALRLATSLTDGNFARARVAAEPLWFDIAGNSNEQKVLWDTANAFRAHLRANPVETDYALYCDYIIEPGGRAGGRVWAVHSVVCDSDGDFVVVDFQNDHHDDFQAIAPKSRADCDQLVARRLSAVFD